MRRRIVRDVTGGGTLEIAPDAVIGEGTRFHVRGATVRVGAGARLGERCVVLAHGAVTIGDGAVLGDDVVLVDFAHNHDDPETPVRHQPLAVEPIAIGPGAIIGHRAVIERGATVPAGARVADGTVFQQQAARSCSGMAMALGEELIGTAPEEELVLVVEQSGPWERDAVAALPEAVAAHAAAAGARIQVVRRKTGRYACERPRAWLAGVGAFLERLDIEHAADLADIALERGAGTPDPGPLVLVCTHSTRDACCARLGLPLHRALARFEPWHSSHLGGHRFAGTLAVLPHGVWLGRVPPGAAEAIVAGVLEGELPLEHLRGVAGRPAAVQAAELHVRTELGLTALDAVAGRLDGDLVRVRTPGGERLVTARREPTGTVRPLSCGEGAKREDPGRWVVGVPTLES